MIIYSEEDFYSSHIVIKCYTTGITTHRNRSLNKLACPTVSKWKTWGSAGHTVEASSQTSRAESVVCGPEPRGVAHSPLRVHVQESADNQGEFGFDDEQVTGHGWCRWGEV